jgi:AraC family cel operon transcriptional repressor
MNKTVRTISIDPRVSFATRLTNSEDEHLHNHDFFELFYISNGSIRHVINGTEEELTIGSAYLIHPDITHTFKRHGTCTHRDFIISQKLAMSVCEFIDPEFFKQLTQKGFIQFKIETDNILFIEKMINSFLQNLEITQRKNYEKVLTSTLFGFAYLFLHSDNNASTFKSLCIQAINNNLTKQNAIDEIRAELGYNKYYLCKKFKASFSCTMVDYINNMRIGHARYLLITTDYKISEICEQLGIESIPYFNKLFCKKYGCPPSKYRKSYAVEINEYEESNQT